jgi:diguanylate cyclase (GGDEF)-like protein
LGAGLIFFDVDHFKQVNDTLGHETGDKALRMIAFTIRHTLRRTDSVGRWGGDEFLAILYEVASLEELRTLSDKIRIMVESSRLDLAGGTLTVTVSAGATMIQTGDTTESIVQRADALMYQSKKAGRNRVTAV